MGIKQSRRGEPDSALDVVGRGNPKIASAINNGGRRKTTMSEAFGRKH